MDSVDNDSTVTGVGSGATSDVSTDSGSSDANVSRDWESVRGNYRSGWEQHHGATGANWDEHEPAHRFAWETRNRPENQNRSYEEVETDLQNEWRTANPNQDYSTASASIREGYDAAGEVLRLHEEQLHARKQNVQTGEVTLHKEVITENKSIEVPVTREEVVIERHAVEGGTAAAGTIDDIAEGETIRVPVMEEQVSVEKTTVPTEEVSVGKP